MRRARYHATVPAVDSPLISVIIAVRNEAASIEGCLDALAAQHYPRDCVDVIVVDGASEDGTAERVAAWSERTGRSVRLVENPRRLTPVAFNLGIRVSRGVVIVILGARARPVADFLAESVAALARSGADAVGGVVETVAATDSITARAVSLAQRSPFGVGDARYRYAEQEGEVDTVNYGAYRRDVFTRIGLFDEELQWVEDDEFNYRLRSAGGRLLLSPRIRVTYQARGSLRGLWLQRYRWGRHKPEVARRHPGQMRARHAAPSLFVLALAGGALLWPFGGKARWPLLATVGAWSTAALAATVQSGRRQGWSRATPLLPAAFLAMHAGYGVGMLVGLVRLVWRPARVTSPPRLENGDA